MKKLFGLTIAALLIIGMVGGGTWAYFSDPEASTDNSLAAGTLDLNWDGGNDSGVAVLNLDTKAPGDTGEAFKLLKNVGSLTGELDVATGVVTNTESIGATEYEADDIGGGGVGELGGVAKIALWIDVNKSGAWDNGDINLINDQSIVTKSGAETLDYQTINSYASKTWNPSNAGVKQMAPLDEHRFYISYDIPTTADNTIQGDSAKISFTFTLEQPAAD